MAYTRWRTSALLASELFGSVSTAAGTLGARLLKQQGPAFADSRATSVGGQWGGPVDAQSQAVATGEGYTSSGCS